MQNMELASYIEEAINGEVDVESLVERVEREVKEIQEGYECFITLANDIRQQVKNLEKTRKGKLFGVFVSVKDNICTKGLRTTAGSKILENYVPPFDATCVEKVKKEGGIIVGKTAMDEFGFGTFCVNTPFSIPKNPFDKSRSCGGSSGGAGCISRVANFPHVAIAESTGGSISCPACFCGVVGLTPTYGRVSRWGLIDYANSLDKIGCMGSCVKDVALLLEVIAGYDERDSTSLKTPVENYLHALKEVDEDSKIVERMRVGVPKEYFAEGVDEKISSKVWDAIKILESEGIPYEEISLPTTHYALPAYYIIAMAEASTNLAKYCGMRYGLHLRLEGNYDEYFSKVRAQGFGEEAKRRILLGTFARMAGYREAYYLKACKVRRKLVNEFKQAFSKFDALLAPTMPILPPKFEEIEKLTPAQAYAMDILTVAPNLAGVPMVSVPCGLVNGLPVGLHILGDHLQEKKILQLAYFFERVRKEKV